MLLIADSGSTKTDWIFCNKENGIVKSIETAGFNPIVQKVDFIESHILNAFFHEDLKGEVTHIYYFGAGCSSDERKKVIHDILQSVFVNAQITVDHDMKAAVIATCGDEKGFSCILGTGSNAVYYDGKEIVQPKGSLGVGYILGDEGSGAHIGKYLLRDFLYHRLPTELQYHLENTLGLNKDIVLHNVYQRPNANTYMASFIKEIYPFKELEYVQNLLKQSFTEFFTYNIAIFPDYQNYPVHFIGSIATHFEAELRSSAIDLNIQVGKIIKKPIESIVRYFLDKEV
ncbi:MAG: hypothetical protein M9958_10300 [Chitinophagales bacterium]|nr:hypothetical protein [Chitinophagales bacterium]